MEIIRTNTDAIILKPVIYDDARGYFFESFNSIDFMYSTGISFHPVQDNESYSKKGVLRGLHFQVAPYSQAKLVRVVKGSVYDIAVDIRPFSKGFGPYTCVHLTEDNHFQFFIPKGYAHGFLVTSDEALFQYKCDDYYRPSAEIGIKWNDPQIGINWGKIMKEYGIEEPILSEKDKKWQTLNEYELSHRPMFIDPSINTVDGMKEQIKYAEEQFHKMCETFLSRFNGNSENKE